MFDGRKIMKSGIKIVNFKSPYTCIYIYIYPDSNPVLFISLLYSLAGAGLIKTPQTG